MQEHRLRAQQMQQQQMRLHQQKMAQHKNSSMNGDMKGADLNGATCIPTSAEKPSWAGRMYKTKLCKEWVTKGWCRRAKRCEFAHGQKELRPVPPDMPMDVANRQVGGAPLIQQRMQHQQQLQHRMSGEMNSMGMGQAAHLRNKQQQQQQQQQQHRHSSTSASASQQHPPLAKGKLHLLIRAIRDRRSYSPNDGSGQNGIRTEQVGKSRRVRVYLAPEGKQGVEIELSPSLNRLRLLPGGLKSRSAMDLLNNILERLAAHIRVLGTEKRLMLRDERSRKVQQFASGQWFHLSPKQADTAAGVPNAAKQRLLHRVLLYQVPRTSAPSSPRGPSKY